MLLQFKFRPYNTRKQRFHPPHHDHAQRATFFWRSFLRAMFGAVAVAKAGGAEKRSESTILRVRATLPSVVERTQRLSTYVNDVCTCMYSHIYMYVSSSLLTYYYVHVLHNNNASLVNATRTRQAHGTHKERNIHRSTDIHTYSQIDRHRHTEDRVREDRQTDTQSDR